jgi:hypothetical protein
MVPRTIENTREPDLTVLTGKTDEDEEVIIDEAGDEMAAYFRKESEPQVLVTTSEDPTSVSALLFVSHVPFSFCLRYLVH